MSRTTYVIRDGELVEKNPAPPCEGPSVIRDIDPYQSPLSGEMVTSRSQRREEMRRHNVVDRRDLKGALLANGKRHRG